MCALNFVPVRAPTWQTFAGSTLGSWAELPKPCPENCMRGFSSHMHLAAFQKRSFPSSTLLPTLPAPIAAIPMAHLYTSSGIALPMLLLDSRALNISKPCSSTTCPTACLLASLAPTTPCRMLTMRLSLLVRVLTCVFWAALASHSKAFPAHKPSVLLRSTRLASANLTTFSLLVHTLKMPGPLLSPPFCPFMVRPHVSPMCGAMAPS